MQPEQITTLDGPATAPALDGGVVVGVDGRAGSMDALALGLRLAQLTRSQLVVVAAYPYAPLSSRMLEGPIDVDTARGALTVARRALGDVDADLRAVAGSSPGRTLHEVAEKVGAGIIAVGSARHGPAGRTVLGSVTAETLRGAPCAVAVATRGWERGTRALSNLGVAADGSARDTAAIAASTWLAGRLQPPASVRTIHVRDVLGRPAAAAQVQLEGEVADALAAYSAGLDLLVLGSQGAGDRTQSVVLGSVAARVVGLARCPVLVLPAWASVPVSSTHVEETAAW